MEETPMLLPFFEAMGQHPASLYIGQSIWLFPLVQAIHLVFLALLAGAILVVDLRLLGLGMRSQPLSQVARDARPWLIVGLLGMVLTGVPQLMSNALRQYYSEYFWQKMGLIAFALVLMVTVRRWATQRAETTMWGKVVAVVSILAWGYAVVSARLIGLFT